MEIIRERISTTLTRDKSEKLWSELNNSYNSIINKMQSELREKIGLKNVNPQHFYLGDIFYSDSGQMLFYRFIEDENTLEAGSFIVTDEEKEAYSEFKSIIQNTISLIKTGQIDWEPVLYTNKQFNLICEETEILTAQKREMNAAFEMKDDSLRNLLKQIKEKGCCFQEDLLSGPDDYETPGKLAKLEELGLITKEFFIFCRETGQQISRVNSLAALEDARAHGFKCFSCGRLISEEKISPQIKSSQLGEKFSHSNYWLALHLIYILENMGYNVNNAYYKTERENKVFDLFYKTMDQFFMFEVKDDPLKLEEVFLFLSRVNFYKPFRAVLISSHTVSPEVKLYLKNSQGNIPITLIEGIKNLESEINNCFLDVKKMYQENLFKSFSPQTYLKVKELLSEKFFPIAETEEAVEEIEEAPKPELVEITREIPAVIIPEESEELVQMEDEVPEVSRTTELQPDMTAEIILEPESEEIEIPEISQEEPSQEEIPPAVEELEEIPVEETGEKKQEEAAEEYVMEFMESLPTEVLPVEELAMGIDTSEEDLDSQAQNILDFIDSEGISGQYPRIKEEIDKISSIGPYSSAIVDINGLIIASHLNEKLNGEALAAYSSGIMENIRNFLEESGIASAQTIHLEGKGGRIKIFPGKEVFVLTYEERKAGEIEDEGGMLPGETVLREAILKKVLENLSHTDGVMGSVIAGRDGLIIETNLPFSLDPDSLGYLSSMVINENEHYMESIEGGPIRQIMIKSPETLYNIIPIEAEGIFTTCLDPYVPREVWQSQLPQSAMMIKSALS